MPRMKRGESIRLVITKAEKQTFFQLAKTRHTTISELIRQLLHREVAAQQKEQAA